MAPGDPFRSREIHTSQMSDLSGLGILVVEMKHSRVLGIPLRSYSYETARGLQASPFANTFSRNHPRSSHVETGNGPRRPP